MNDVYLNNAATSYPKPREVEEAVRTALADLPHDSRRGYADHGPGPVERCRFVLAQLLGVADPATIILTSSATEALNLLAFGSGLEGHHVITSAAEHNSVLRPLKALVTTRGVTLSIVACDGNGRVDPGAIAEAITPGTRAIVVTHASNVTGALNDIPAIACIAHDHGLRLYVDASQSAGHAPIDAAHWGADAIVFAGHKGLFGPPGIGGVVLRPGLPLEPLKVGGTGSHSSSLAQPPDWPERYEAGTANLPGIAGLRAGAEFVLRHGIDRTDHRADPVNRTIDEGLQEIPGIRIHGGSGLAARLPIWSCSVGTMDPEECAHMLYASFGITTRAGLHCAPLIHEAIGAPPGGTVRISPSRFTTMAEAEYLLDALRRISAGHHA
jgi:cysteine desulfurase / selenocysteine lyase